MSLCYIALNYIGNYVVSEFYSISQIRNNFYIRRVKFSREILKVT